MTAQPNIVFREVQRLWRVRWLWIVFAVVCLSGVARVLSFARDLTFKPMPELAYVAAFYLLGPLVFLVFVLVAKVETQVRTDGVYVRSFPIRPSFRAIPLDGLVAVEATAFRPFRFGSFRDYPVFRMGLISRSKGMECP